MLRSSSTSAITWLIRRSVDALPVERISQRAVGNSERHDAGIECEAAAPAVLTAQLFRAYRRLIAYVCGGRPDTGRRRF